MPIQILSPQLANQIAAGEVVERPASVIKELIENSIDAGATQIDIDIEAGGSKLIRIRDNGCGISKDELGLALSRHATSKVASLDDLEAIVSLGFRGEALASISSVSRLSLSSKTEQQSEAWQAIAEGRDMKVDIQPTAHPVGTTIEVADLFFNTPARRRFLRTDKTEFAHIEEVVKRIALSRFDVQIKLNNNGKLHKHYRIAKDDKGKARRIATVCGQAFVDNCLLLEASYDCISISGWLGEPQVARQQRDLQYCYVNGRMMKDKLINHAIRQAFESRIASDQHAAYILFIELDPKQVDVNVHPAKHEVRFHQARLIHDYIYQAVHSAINQKEFQLDAIGEGEGAYHEQGQHQGQYQESIQQAHANDNTDDLYAGQTHPSQFSQSLGAGESRSASANYTPSNYSGAGKSASHQGSYSGAYVPPPAIKAHDVTSQIDNYAALLNVGDKPQAQSFEKAQVDINKPLDGQCNALCLIHKNYILFKIADELYLFKDSQLNAAVLKLKFAHICQSQNNAAQPLLLPIAFKAEPALLTSWQNNNEILKRLNIEITQPRADTLVIQKVPSLLRECNLACILPSCLLALAETAPILETEQLARASELLITQMMKYATQLNWADITSLIKDYTNLSSLDLASVVKTEGIGIALDGIAELTEGNND